jgi:hypothetical protein
MQFLLKKFTIRGIYSLHSFKLALLVYLLALVVYQLRFLDYLLALLGYLIVTQLICNRCMGDPELFG